ncbi:MAG: hypothetical protein H0V29_08565 [Thermoleophilaceae bacterium]|nr:hypothetical protein [Thermoleophilaceae bacterium]
MGGSERSPKTEDRHDPWRLNEIVRARRLREDARRPMAVNLDEGLRLSEFLASFAGAARRK